MNTVSTFRLYLLRALYLLIGIAMGSQVWPDIVMHDKPWELMDGVVVCMLGAFSALCLLGVRYPLQMIPVLLWELIWKSTWLLVVALPQWQAGTMDAATANNAAACLWVVLVPIALPWRYVFDNYFRKAGDPWSRRAAPVQPAAAAGSRSAHP